MPNSPVYMQVAELVGKHPGGLTRADIAQDFSIGKGTAQYHLEKCVERGLLFKTYTWISERARGWLYFAPQTQETYLDGSEEE